MTERRPVDYSCIKQFSIDEVPDRFSCAVYVKCDECGEQHKVTGGSVIIRDPVRNVMIHDWMRQHIDEEHGGFTLTYEDEDDE